MVKSLRAQCIELLTEIEARLDFDDEMPPLDVNLVIDKIHKMLQEVNSALETSNYDKLLQSGLQVSSGCSRYYFVKIYLSDAKHWESLLIYCTKIVLIG